MFLSAAYNKLLTRAVNRVYEIAIMVTKQEFLVAKDKMLAALATLSVAISNPLTMYLTKFYGWTITSKEEVKMCWQNVWTQCPIVK